jgi:hypothetical protein
MTRTLLFCLALMVGLQLVFSALALSRTASTVIATLSACALYVALEWRRGRPLR